METKIIKFKDITKLKQWKNLPIKDLKPEGYPVYGANGTIGYYDEYNHESPTLAITCRGATCGNIHLTQPKSYITSNAMALDDLDTTKIDLNYLRLILQYRGFDDVITGAAQPQITRRNLEKIKLTVPKSINDQIKIANLLSQVEALIAKREESINLLDALLRSTFLDMFGDPVLNGKGWDKVPLSKLGEINRGVSKHRPRNAPELLGGKYPLIQTGDVSNADLYVEKFTQTYSDIGLAQSKLWGKDTLCITIAANIAKTAILKFDACFPDSVVGMEINKEETNLFYIHFLFKFFQKLLEKNAPQAAQKNINLQILRNLKVPQPNKPLQDKFATIVQQVEESKEKYQDSLDELRDLFGSLSQRAFRGELELEDTKKVLALDLKVGLDSSVANTLAVASKIKGLGVKLPKLGIDTSSLSIGSKVADSIAKLDTLSKITSASKIRDLGVKLPKVGIDISSINSLSKVMGSSLVGNEYSSLHDKLSSLSTVNMTDMLSTSSRALRDSFMTTEQLSQNLLGHTFELDKYTKGLSSTYFDTWRKEEENRISELISKHTLGFSSQELWTNKISETFNKTALDNLESAYGITKLSSNIWEEENARLDAIKVKFSDDWQTEQEKFQELVGLGKYDESILSFKKEHESLFDLPVTATSFDTNIIDGTKYLEEMHSTIDNLGLDAINKAFEVSQPYKIALEQAEAMKSLYGWGEPYETLIDKYSEQVEETKEIIESISNLSELIHDELFENLMWNESYDNIKALVYKLIDEGKLEQVFDEDKDNSKLLLKKVEK